MQIANKNLFLLLLILLIFIDQLAKYIIRSFGGFYICNEGIAFGINLPYWVILTLAIGFVCFIGLLILNLKFEIRNKLFNFKFLNFDFNSNLKLKILNFPLILIFSGALSNLFDRISYDCVIDFIDLKIWPIFNLADIFICVGVFFLILRLNKK
jgi:signal peptidase II